MTVIERLGRMLGADQALAYRCEPCGEDWRISRDAAVALFGADATRYEVDNHHRCRTCHARASFDGVATMDTAAKPPPRLRSLPMATPDTITFAICGLAGWTVYGNCEACRTTKLLYAPGVQGRKSPHPTVLIGPSWRAGGLTCAPCKRAFASVRIDDSVHTIAAWGDRPGRRTPR